MPDTTQALVSFDQIYEYFTVNNLVTHCQSGFRSLHSKITVLIEPQIAGRSQHRQWLILVIELSGVQFGLKSYA